MNTYAYVAGNPTRNIDFFGLNQCDVQRARDYISDMFPNLDHPLIAYSYTLPPNDAGKLIDGNIVLPAQQIYENLSSSEFRDLINTIYHETLHANDTVLGNAETFWGDLFGGGLGSHHRKIWNTADDFTDTHKKEINDIYDNTRGKCGCAN